ncbi:MAG: hypothetical protein Q7S53_03575 [bacterium]|nr:hypothetical protein [bacterium]
MMAPVPKVKLDIDKIKDQLASLMKIAKTKSWKFAYDEELDCLYYSPEELKGNLITFSFDKEFTFYIDTKSNIHGFFIEYFSTNFLEHEKKFKELPGMMTKEENGLKVVPKKDQEKSELVETALVSEVMSGFFQNTKNLKDLVVA